MYVTSTSTEKHVKTRLGLCETPVAQQIFRLWAQAMHAPTLSIFCAVLLRSHRFVPQAHWVVDIVIAGVPVRGPSPPINSDSGVGPCLG